jgi:hypothetical protein
MGVRQFYISLYLLQCTSTKLYRIVYNYHPNIATDNNTELPIYNVQVQSYIELSNSHPNIATNNNTELPIYNVQSYIELSNYHPNIATDNNTELPIYKYKVI